MDSGEFEGSGFDQGISDGLLLCCQRSERGMSSSEAQVVLVSIQTADLCRGHP